MKKCLGCGEPKADNMFSSNGRGGKRKHCTLCLSFGRQLWGQTARTHDEESYLHTGVYGIAKEYRQWVSKIRDPVVETHPDFLEQRSA